ncbi:MAG: hypothetical protein RLZ12_744 [Bacillota bacterium]
MPELPEVETVRQSLLPLLKNKKITNIKIFLPKLIRYPKDTTTFIKKLISSKITDIERRGKFLLFRCPPYTLISHLRMEGHYQVCSKESPITNHTHIIFTLDDKTELRYQDVRQFGTLDLVHEQAEATYPPLKNLGPDPLTAAYTLEWFTNRLASKKRGLKAMLLDQTFIAGLGNIYTDEVLHRSKLHPQKLSNSLTKLESSVLFHNIRNILQHAVKEGGSSIRTYTNAQGKKGTFQKSLLVYGRTGLPCRTCHVTIIERIKVASRGTHFCPSCQTGANFNNA